MKYRIDNQGLLDRLSVWDGFLKRKVHLIACGGTAMTLLGIKDSTKDIDLIVPNLTEYNYLTGTLKQIGYESVTGAGWSRGDGFIFDLFRGNRVHTTELLESPLKKGNHVLIKEFSRIYLGALNYYDLIISKLFRATEIDLDDCLSLIKEKGREINIPRLKERFQKTASYDVSEHYANKNLGHFLKILKKEGLSHEKEESS
ncbi:MAG: hypothetical protein KKH29_02985 [Candidatus Omnitrophica bacterium]|nr:hypothetical protein [Candidatus Omnitrophota bacterium]MBU4473529.1 hypothetical protein [Candidatus Omnitrophota bacterium]MCG2706168.1 hypothetical protein [Candidatus Omnitrophota bacterium]